MPMRSKRLSDMEMDVEEEFLVRNGRKSYKKKWRLAYNAFCFTRLLITLAKKVKNVRHRRSVSYVAVSIQTENDADLPFVDVDQKALNEMVREKNVDSLNQFGGVKRLCKVLDSNAKDGLSGDIADLEHRRKAFGSNRYHKPPARKFLSFVIEAFKDMTIIILLVCAILSLAFGIKQHGLKEGWYDGGSIIVAIILVIAVASGSNFKQSRQFQKLSNQSSDIRVEIVRDGRRQSISIFDVVVGDIAWMKIGDQVPADGLFLDGHSLKIDESSMTGESDHVDISDKNPFLLAGTKVTDGYGCMLVTSVGMNTLWGEMMSSLTRDLDEETPLQERLNKLTSSIGKIGVSVAVLVLVVMMVRYFTGHTVDEYGNREYIGRKTKTDDIINAVLRIVAAAVTIIVVAIPEGLPLAVTLTLAFSMKRMMADQSMVRKLSACETMGSATTICTDKTGTLTLNEMKVTEFWLGKEAMNSTTLDIKPAILELLLEGVALNTIATVNRSASAQKPEISGSPTEKAILSWAVFDLSMNINEVKHGCEMIQVEAFNSEKKRSGVSMRKNNESAVHSHWKGAAEMILATCSNYYTRIGSVESLDDQEREYFGTIIRDMAAKSLRCIAFAHKRTAAENTGSPETLEESGLTLIGIVGLKDPCRPGVTKAVESCRRAGVGIKMVTGDNVHTARAIAIECGILRAGEELDDEAVVEGVQFRNFSPEERTAKVDNIRVMARSSPFDKLLMVQCLKQKGHVVAVTGDGTNDAPALKEADIGLSMGIQGTEVAKESSDIVILDDNFSSVVTVLRWGRCVYNNIQKFLQFQLTVNAAALTINFVAAMSSGDVPLTAVQLLWVNLIMDTLGALALATERPTNELMKKTPVGRSEPLITKVMWRNLLSQAIYQIAILLTLQFRGKEIFGVDEDVKSTLIFNTFVFCQVFNEFNARKLEKKNIFEGIHTNKLFVGIVLFTIVLQIVMVEFLKEFADTVRLGWGQWGACIIMASLTWPIGFIVKFIPVQG